MYPELQAIEDQLDAAARDAEAVASSLNEERGCWCPQTGSWSVSECLDHLATTNRVYLTAMEPAAWSGRKQGRRRGGPALPGVVGGLFVKSLEPPVKPLLRMRAPKNIRPSAQPSLAESLAGFLSSQDAVRAFLHANEDLDLAAIHFVNPFLPGVRFSLATGLHVIPGHERRHLWQAWNVRRLMERADLSSHSSLAR
jgi:DinB superfamily